MGNSFLQTVYNLTDTYWLGRIGTEPLAGINLVTPVQNMVISFGGGLTTAGAVLIAQLMGAKAHDRACRMASQIFFCAMLFALTMSGLISALSAQIVSALGAGGGTLQNGVDYLRIVILDMPFLFTINIFQAVHQAQGNTFRPMILNLLGIALNLVLDPLLMAVWKLGAAGAALATVGAKAVPAAIALYLLTRPEERIRLRTSLMRPEKENLKAIVRIGLPTALGSSTMQFGFLLLSRTVNGYGAQAMAAYGIGNKINGLISLPANGAGSAVSTIVGQNFGANQKERAEKAFLRSMLMTVLFLLIGGILLGQSAVAQAAVRLFSRDEAVIRLGAGYLRILALSCWVNGIYNCAAGLFQGSGHTEITMFSDVSRLWVYRFAVLWFCSSILRMGVESVWYAVAVSNALAAAVLFILYKGGIWRKNRVRVKE